MNDYPIRVGSMLCTLVDPEKGHEVDYNRVLPLTYAVFLLLTAFGLLAIFRDIIDPINIG